MVRSSERIRVRFVRHKICTCSSRRREVSSQIEVNEIMNVGEQEHRGVEVIRYGAKGGMVLSPMGKTTWS